MSEEVSEKKQLNCQFDDVEELEEYEALNKPVVKAVLAEMISEYNGPIPPPSMMKQYEEVKPGMADRILTMAEEQSKHRREMEKIMIASESRDSLLGVIFSFAICFICLLVSVIIVFCSPTNAGVICGAILGATGISSVVTSFLKYTRSNYNIKDDETESEEK